MTPPEETLLLICQEGCAQAALAQECSRLGLSLVSFFDVQEALRWCALNPPNLRGIIVCDDPRRTHLEWIVQLPKVRTAALVRQGDVARTVVAMQSGAHAVLEMPAPLELPAISSVLAALEISEISEVQDDQDSFIRATNSPMNALLDLLPQIAHMDAPLVISGPLGVGKTKLAKHLHMLSPRQTRPLYCHDAHELDTLEKLRNALSQAKMSTLLIQNAEVWDSAFQEMLLMKTAVYEQSPRLILTITHDKSEAQVLMGTASAEKPLMLLVPALSERPQDILPLCEHFIAQHHELHGSGIVGLTREVVSLLKNYGWPGNIRELEDVVFSMCEAKQHGFLERDDLPSTVHHAPPAPLTDLDLPSEGIDMTQTLDDLERDLLARALDKAQGNKSKAARLLGINRTTLVEKIKRKQMEFNEQGKAKTA